MENLEKFMGFLSRPAMTAAGGASLVLALLLSGLGVPVPVSPAVIATAASGLPIAYAAAWQLVNGKGVERVSSAMLITMAMAASVAIGEMFAAGEIAFIMAIGEILEAKTVERARSGLKRLISLAPLMGRISRDYRDAKYDREEMIPAEQIREGDILRVLPGEAIPVDGEIISGETSVDQSVMTGESLPVDKTVGDAVFCGTINRFGSVYIRADKVGEDSSLKKLIKLVNDAEKEKAPVQRIADRWAARLVPAALLVAAAALLFTRDITRAVTVLIVFCPCALVLATPTAVMAAIGQAAKHGVIIKSGAALERMAAVATVACDKTGTLTEGKLSVTGLTPFSPEYDDGSLLVTIASAEQYSEHPLGKAITSFARGRGAALKQAENFKMIPGRGISAVIGGKAVLCGSAAYLNECGVALDGGGSVNAAWNQGKATVIAAADGKLIGFAALSDAPRENAAKTVSELMGEGVGVVLLTGDNRQTAAYFAEKVGISDVFAELLPDGKTAKIKELEKGGRVCMVGDGVNDAPALKTATVGIAMGGAGSDIAVDSADIALIGDDISKLPYLRRLASAAVKIIKLNIALSVAINIAAVALSVMALLTPVTGALVHNAGSLIVVLNAALLYDRKF